MDAAGRWSLTAAAVGSVVADAATSVDAAETSPTALEASFTDGASVCVFAAVAGSLKDKLNYISVLKDHHHLPFLLYI